MSYDFLERVIERHLALGWITVDRLRANLGLPPLRDLTSLAERRAAEAEHHLFLQVCNVTTGAVYYQMGLLSGGFYQGEAPIDDPPTPNPVGLGIRFARDPEGALIAVNSRPADTLPHVVLLPTWRLAALAYGLPPLMESVS